MSVAFNYFNHCLALRRGQCIKWGLSATTAIAENFYATTGTYSQANATTLLDRDRFIAVDNSEVFVWDLTDTGRPVRRTNDFGLNWSSQSYESWQPVDQEWKDGEKVNQLWAGAAWPPGGPVAGSFSTQRWKWHNGQLVATIRHGASRTTYTANVSGDTVLVSGFAQSADTETDARREFFVGPTWNPTEGGAFCYSGDTLVRLGMVYQLITGDPYPQKIGLSFGESTGESLTLLNGSGDATMVERINDKLLFYGTLGGADGGGTATRYGEIDVGIGRGDPYIFKAAWNGSNNWLSTNAQSAVYQPTRYKWSTTTGMPTTNKHRPVKWLAEDFMFSGTSTGNTTCWKWTGVEAGEMRSINYSSLREGRLGSIEVMPVQGANVFASMEIPQGATRTNVKVRFSHDGELSSFSPVLTVTLPVNVSSTNMDNNQMAMYYSKSKRKFMFVYKDVGNKLRVVTFDDLRVCEQYE